MNKDRWYKDQIFLFKKIYPEKTEKEIVEMIDRHYDKFADIIETL